MIRRDLAPALITATTRTAAVSLVGPRQSGKSTLCRALFPNRPYRTLDAPDHRAFAAHDPLAFLGQFPDGAVIAEVQRVPDLLAHLPGVGGSDSAPGRWILTSSRALAGPVRGGQAVAGRIDALHLLPLAWSEVTRLRPRPRTFEEAMFSGGYPAIFADGLDPSRWLRFHVADYIEREVRSISNVGDLASFQRFVEACAARSARLLNYSALAAECGISQPTAKAWVGILESTFVAFRLPAFRGDIGRRLVRAPKLYFHDTGLLCWLLGIREAGRLRSHRLRRSIFETWVVSEIVKHRANRGESTGPRLSFYRDRHGAEVALVIEQPEGPVLVDVSAAATPSPTLFQRAERVRRHFGDRPAPNVAVVYAGEPFRSRGPGGRLIPWWRVPSVATSRAAP